MFKRSVGLYIEDVRDAIEKIEKYTKGLSFNTFIKDEKTVDAVVKKPFCYWRSCKKFSKRNKT